MLIQKKKKKETNSYLKTIYLLHKSDIGNENSHIAFLIYIFDAYTIIEMKLWIGSVFTKIHNINYNLHYYNL